MGKIKFYKYHGAGNDFILINVRDNKLTLSKGEIATLCHRRYGIGADGLMLLGSAKGYDFRMQYFNADGGEVAMCGNGARVITLFARHMGVTGDRLSFIASDGPHSATILSDDGTVGSITVELIDVEHVKEESDYTFMNTGVPHHVIFTDDLDGEDVVGRGRAIRMDKKLYPEGVNVNFVQIKDEKTICVRTYERGVEDETLACGTGIAASVIATILRSETSIQTIDVEALGGRLSVSIERDGTAIRNILLSGPAERVFEGYI